MYTTTPKTPKSTRGSDLISNTVLYASEKMREKTNETIFFLMEKLHRLRIFKNWNNYELVKDAATEDLHPAHREDLQE